MQTNLLNLFLNIFFAMSVEELPDKLNEDCYKKLTLRIIRFPIYIFIMMKKGSISYGIQLQNSIRILI